MFNANEARKAVEKFREDQKAEMNRVMLVFVEEITRAVKKEADKGKNEVPMCVKYRHAPCGWMAIIKYLTEELGFKVETHMATETIVVKW